GVFSHAVENTLDAVEAAAAGGPDFVEIDVQQTADGGFVVFHDSTLNRLAGDPRRVADLTTRELRQVTIRQNGREDRIPTPAAVLARANQLDQKLFIELKTHGNESENYLENLVALLDRYDALDTVRVGSFNRRIIEEFAQLEPTVPAGLLISLALGRAPA